MAKNFNNSFSNSLKGKIWLSTVALAFFICTFGTVSYILVSFLINDPFYAIFIPFFLLALIVVAFGLWLSNEVVSPVERVLLLTKSLERGISTSLPRTSGASETDELLQTIHRISQQVQKLLGSMEEVSQGRLDEVYTQNSGSDRISVMFQKLLAKVSESIHAKQDLEKLQSAVTRLTDEVAVVRKGDLSITANGESKSTKEIALSVNYLVEHLGELVGQVKSSSAQSQTLSVETKKTLQNIIRQDEARTQKMIEASITLKKVPQAIEKISIELGQSFSSASQSIEKAHQGAQKSQSSFNAANHLRQQIKESVRRIQKLSESSKEIEAVAKTVGDLAHRTNLVALNASIQATELGEQGRGFVVVSQEIERLAERADNTNRHIHTLGKSIQAEIEKVEDSLEATVGEMADLSKFAIETGTIISELERHLAQYINLQEKMVAYVRDQTNDTEQALETFTGSIVETEKFIVELRESSEAVEQISRSMEGLQSAVAQHNKFSNGETGKTDFAKNTATKELVMPAVKETTTV